jgi:hypothetical protein
MNVYRLTSTYTHENGNIRTLAGLRQNHIDWRNRANRFDKATE